MVDLELGDFSAAIEAFERLIPRCGGQPQIEAGLRAQLGIAHHLAGRLERARQLLLSSLEVAHATPLVAALTELHLAAVEAEMGLDGVGRLAHVRERAATVVAADLAILALAVTPTADLAERLAAVDRKSWSNRLAVRVVEAVIARR